MQNASYNDAVKYDDTQRLYIYLGIVSGFLVMSILRGVLLSSFTYAASRRLHDSMFAKILHAPMRFFERNPVGECDRYHP